MNILLVSATYPPSANGVAVSIYNLKNSLIKAGHTVKVLAPENKDANPEPDVIRYPSLNNPIVKDYPIPLFPGVKSIYKLITSFKPDIIHVHHPFHIGFFARVIAEKYKIPLVYTFHTQYDLYAEKYFRLLPEKLKVEFVANRVENFCKTTDLIILPSEFLKKDFENKYGFLNYKTIPSGNPVLPVSGYSKLSLRRRLNLPENKKILLTVSRISREKNLDLLIRSMQKIPDNYLLVIVGDGPDHYRMGRLVANNDLTDKVKFAGKVLHKDINMYYQAADIFYYASDSETQGLVYLEAMTFGLPIVTVNSPATSEWLNDKAGISVKPSSDELARAVVSITEEKVKKMRQEAEKLSARFSPDKISARMIDAYEETIKRKELAYKLLETGWQSWSPSRKRIVKIPMWNYKPNKDYFLPPVNTELTLKKPATGWCSWYSFAGNIDRKKILGNSKWFKENNIPIDYILIDDGWTRWGDWCKANSKKFPGGLKTTAKKISDMGFKPGIWLAPFLADPKSDFFKSHKQLFVKSRGMFTDGFRGFPMSNILYPRYILDVRQEKAFTEIIKTIDFLLDESGFRLIKLDFLYSLFFIPGISEKEAGFFVHKIFSYVRSKYPEVYTIACGVPLATVVGVADSVRVGPDIIDPLILSGGSLVKKAANSYRIKRVLGNLEKRYWTRKYWNLDPDVFVCRAELGLSETQIHKLNDAIIKSKGNLFFGDDMTRLQKDRIEKYIMPFFNRYADES